MSFHTGSDRPDLSGSRAAAARRTLVAGASALLLLATTFVAGPTPSIFAFGIVSEGGSAGYVRAERAMAPAPSPAAVTSAASRSAKVQADRVEPSSRGGVRAAPDLSTESKFIAAVAEAARESQLDCKVPASVTVAQAILESDWGKSLLSTKAFNFFGIKARSGPGPAGVVNMNTWEVFSGKDVVVNDGFKAYHNLWESVMDHGRFLVDNSRYSAAFKFTADPPEFARKIHEAGYATDPAYSTKLINLMNKFNLYQYDLP